MGVWDENPVRIVGNHAGTPNTNLEVICRHSFPIAVVGKIAGDYGHLEFTYDKKWDLKSFSNGRGIRVNQISSGMNMVKYPSFTKPEDRLPLSKNYAVPGPSNLMGVYGTTHFRMEMHYWVDGSMQRSGIQFGNHSSIRIEFNQKGFDRIIGRQDCADTNLEIIIPDGIKPYCNERKLYPLLLSFL